MAPITHATEVDRAPDEVFAYVTDPSRFAEWQQNIVDGRMEADGPPAVGDRCLTTRKIGLAKRPVTAEITHIDPPRAWGVQGIDGPIRATVDLTVAPLDHGQRSRVTIGIDFRGHGIGKVLVPLVVRREARNEMPVSLRNLKERLENSR